MAKNKIKKINGFAMTFTLIVSFVAVGLILGISRFMLMRTHQYAYYTGKARAFEVAEKGLQDALGQLIYQSQADQFTGTFPDYEGTYTSRVVERQRDLPVSNCTYIVTDASVLFHGKQFSTRLHSYVQISNVGEYFAAVNNDMGLGHGIDISEGKIFAQSIRFDVSQPAGTITKVLSAEFLREVWPPLDEGNPDDIADDKWDETQPPFNGTPVNQFLQVNPSNGLNDGRPPYNAPRQLKGGLVFPQVLNSDLDLWRNQADTTRFNFSGVTAPPSQDIHIYYSDQPIHIKGIVEGQVLFVSEENIYIDGNLLKSTNAPPLGSEANQAVLITRKNVIISNQFLTTAPGGPVKQTIEAMIFAPNGTLITEPYPDPTWHENLQLQFHGAWVVDKLSDSPLSLPNVFRNERVYAYDTDLRDFPPPYLPALSKIYYSFEEFTDAPDVF